MINNATIKEIGKTLLHAGSVMLFPHESPDGDAIGACVALCRMLRNSGIASWVLVDEELPEYVRFIDDGCCTADQEVISEPDICALIDCSGEDRIPGRSDKYREGKVHVCLDHHLAAYSDADMYYIDDKEAAASQIIYKLIRSLNVTPDRVMANAIYAGICSDTGNFQYSNTTEETHRIAAELFAAGIDHNDIMVQLHQNVDERQIKLESAALADMTIFAGGKGAIACIRQKTLADCGALMEHGEHLIDVLRDMKGVEIAAVLKEKAPDMTKASFRAKTYADVSKVAAIFGGGGHVKASGCTIHENVDTARESVMKAIEEALR
ncbi:MAG: bifunctional oligoribonuclease/PAP phosphatase NrnA [Bacillota bacterium]|nr:bifunctional oligoribonuclease/PAP phosphatase NrnA [Bacillota bacterium]